MNAELSIMIERLGDPTICQSEVIEWGCPVPSFGSISSSRIATLGLNPSNREFVDKKGRELVGINQRFHTLNSLGLSKWSDVQADHLHMISDCCIEYFNRNPYDVWFKKLDNLISGTAISYYFPSGQACHLDLIPYATAKKWTELSSVQQSNLLEHTSDTLGLLLKNSSIELLVLNGKTVVSNLEKVANEKLVKQLMPNWTLPRLAGGVAGFSYEGEITKIGGVQLGRKIKVLGFNHNIQSSFGVTKEVQSAIRNWISDKAKQIL